VAAKSYAEELRGKLLSEPPPPPGFLRRHARLALSAAVVVVVAAAVGTFLAVRSHRRTDEARAAVDSARKGLARDTSGALREAARVLDGALRHEPGPAASALATEVAALLAHDFGDAEARRRAAELLAPGRAGESALVARWLLAEKDADRDAAATALLDAGAAPDPLLRALAGQILVDRRELYGARAHLEAAARATPPMVRALAALGDLELLRGDTEAALSQYELALRAHATHPHAAIGAAEARLRLDRDLPGALRTLQAVAADPDSVPVAGDKLRLDVALGRLLGATGRYADAEALLAAAGHRAPDRPEVAAAQAEVFARAGDVDRALRAAAGAARLAPGDPIYREALARLQLGRGLYRELLAGTEASPSRTLRLYRGVARLELGEADKARLELEATRREGKMPAEAAAWMALTELALGHRAQASALTAALLSSAQPHAVALLARGRLDLAEGRADAAERRFREAVERDPELVQARCDLGLLLLARGRPGEARDVLEKAVARQPTDAEARLELGRARLATGDAAGAARELEAAVAERPRDGTALRALSAARLALGDAPAARRAAERALDAEPRDPASWLAAGKAAAADRDVRSARRFLEKAARLAGKGRDAAEARRALASLGRR
jgi:predicted Zn-dependent protease